MLALDGECKMWSATAGRILRGMPQKDLCSWQCGILSFIDLRVLCLHMTWTGVVLKTYTRFANSLNANADVSM